MVLELAPPLRGPWRALHSPTSRVPSHGTTMLALSHALDLLPVDERGRTAPIGLRALLGTEEPDLFPGFGREVLAPAPGRVVSAVDGAEDHAARRGLSSVGYALTQRARLREGWAALAGNHVVLEIDGPGPERCVALCHLQRGSVAVRPGESVRAGGLLGRCGNSGNSTEPHVHLQVMDAPDPTLARAVPFTLPGGIPPEGGLARGL